MVTSLQTRVAEGTANEGIFDEAYLVVAQALEHDLFPKFKADGRFQDYLEAMAPDDSAVSFDAVLCSVHWDVCDSVCVCVCVLQASHVRSFGRPCRRMTHLLRPALDRVPPLRVWGSLRWQRPPKSSVCQDPTAAVSSTRVGMSRAATPALCVPSGGGRTA